jgi:hypothetical protein
MQATQLGRSKEKPAALPQPAHFVALLATGPI